MDMLEIRVFTGPQDMAWKPEDSDVLKDSLVYLQCPGTLVEVSEVENAIIGVLREFRCSYAIKSTRRTVDWGASGSTGDIVAHVAPFIESAVSGAVGALTYSIVQRIFEKLSASSRSRHVNQSDAIGLEAREVKARDYMRSQFGQEAGISLLCASEVENNRYAFQYECGDRRVEIIIGRDLSLSGFRRL